MCLERVCLHDDFHVMLLSGIRSSGNAAPPLPTRVCLDAGEPPGRRPLNKPLFEGMNFSPAPSLSTLQPAEPQNMQMTQSILQFCQTAMDKERAMLARLHSRRAAPHQPLPSKRNIHIAHQDKKRTSPRHPPRPEPSSDVPPSFRLRSIPSRSRLEAITTRVEAIASRSIVIVY